jgi:hypothetical protein
MNEINESSTSAKPNLANITGGKIIAQPSVKTLTINDPLKGQKTIVPVSDEIARFIKDEFSKIKSEI